MANDRKHTLIRGTPASPGTAKGVVKILQADAKNTDFPTKAVLVAQFTNNSMLLSLMRSSAIVTDVGGVASHAAIVARELGIPCVVATNKATSLLRDGMLVEVNGTTGAVYEVSQ